MSALFLYVVFFLSGIAALVYQLAWQRKLFTIFGTNIESITVVVTAFMLGLGLGSLAGGLVSRKTQRAPLLFALMELGIGTYGIFSLDIFEHASRTIESAAIVGLISSALVLVPTLLMGATLPLLVMHLVRQNGSVGESTGYLYFANTAGAAFGAFLCSIVLFRFAGLSGSVYAAAALNFLSAGLILVRMRRPA